MPRRNSKGKHYHPHSAMGAPKTALSKMKPGKTPHNVEWQDLHDRLHLGQPNEACPICVEIQKGWV